jgi:hypothetical protein
MRLKKWRVQIMRYNIIATGSEGNCALATFSDERKVLFDFGKGCFKKCTEAGLVLNAVNQILISHAHNDHIGDAHLIPHLLEKKSDLEIYSFPLTHNVENVGFLVVNVETREAIYYLTDFYDIPKDSMATIVDTLQFLNEKNCKIMFIMELSFCQHLYEKLDDVHKFGLRHHLSDVEFFRYAKQFKAFAPKINFITTHASQRGGWSQEQKGWNGTVCPPDWVKIQLFNRLGNARFGEAFGFAKTYNHIEHKFKAS